MPNPAAKLISPAGAERQGPANALSGLRKATSIGPGSSMPYPDMPYGSQPGEMKGEMPLGPGGLGSAIGGLGKAAPAVETLGERMAEFTPVGGEWALNMGRSAPKAAAENPFTAEQVMKYLSKLGAYR